METILIMCATTVIPPVFHVPLTQHTAMSVIRVSASHGMITHAIARVPMVLSWTTMILIARIAILFVSSVR